MDRDFIYDAVLLSAVHSAHAMSEKVRELIKLGRTSEEIHTFLTEQGTFNVAFQVARPWAHQLTERLWKNISDPTASDVETIASIDR